ncbi:MAG: MarC family protein [Pseudomonadota bacterium]
MIDPIGLAPLFVALTAGMSFAQRRRIGAIACLIAFGLLTIFGLFGDRVLAFIGISMPAFRIAGGILLFLTALDMLFERRTKRREERVEEDDPADDPTVFPLAMPLIAGPGAMATMVLLIGETDGTVFEVAAMHGAMAAVLLIAFVLFLGAGLLERALGPLGINLVTRLLGMLLAALSVQFVIDGVAQTGLIPT